MSTLKLIAAGTLLAAWVPTTHAAAFPTFTKHVMGHEGGQGGTGLADVDGDGDLDFMNSSTKSVWWHEYRGPNDWVSYKVGNESGKVSGDLKDIDGDGRPDYIGGKGWYRNVGGGGTNQFEYISIQNWLTGGHDRLLADMDGDGKTDIVGLGNNFSAPLKWYKQPADPTARRVTWPETAFGNSSHGGLAIGDLDGDGDMDVIANQFRWYENRNGAATDMRERVLAGAGDLNWSDHGGSTTAIGDIDGDGDNDVMVGEHDANEIAWLENDGSGNFTTHHMFDGMVVCHSVAIADFDNDGDNDLYAGDTGNEGGNLYIWENKGNRTFVRHIIATGAVGHNAMVGDVDGDGDLDICGKNWRGKNEFVGLHLYYQNRLIDGPGGGEPNQAPVLDQQSITATLGPSPTTQVALSASATDPDGDPLTYTWTATAQPVGANPTIPGGRTPTVALDQAGDYTFTVVVSDGSLSDDGTVTIEVEQAVSDLVVSP